MVPTKKKLGIAILLMAALSLPVMAQQAASPQRPQVTRGGAYDQKIQQEVNEYLRGKDKLKNVQASVEDGLVTLKGSVELLRDKMTAEEKLRHKEHVAGVRDLIVVKGKDVPDEKLRDQLADKLRYDRVDQGQVFNNLTVGVNQGVAVVGGQVRTDADRSSALYAVANTPGVKGLIDNIQVAPVSNFDDDLRVAVARAVYGKLPMYANDPQKPIRIVVDGGHVSLYGVVNSKVDRQVAVAEARGIPGVMSVTDKLLVDSGEAK